MPITPEQVTAAINGLEEFHFDPLWFAFNQVRVERMTWDRGGKLMEGAGFYLVPDSGELFHEQITGQHQHVEIPSEAGAYYLVRYRSKGAGRSPVIGVNRRLETSKTRAHGCKANVTWVFMVFKKPIRTRLCRLCFLPMGPT